MRDDELSFLVSYTKFETKREVILQKEDSDSKSIANFAKKVSELHPS
jgi:hypothetical protein